MRCLQRLESSIGEFTEGVGSFSGPGFPLTFTDVTLRASRVQEELRDTCAWKLTHGQMLGSILWVSRWEYSAVNTQL